MKVAAELGAQSAHEQQDDSQRHQCSSALPLDGDFPGRVQDRQQAEGLPPPRLESIQQTRNVRSDIY